MLFTAEPIDVPMAQAQVTYYPQWLGSAQATLIAEQLKAELCWSQDYIKVFGREVKIPRLQAWYGDPEATYTYSQLAMTPLEWHPCLAKLRAQLQSDLACSFNSVLANWYRDGADSMGMHSDDEPELGTQPVIASLTFGEPRAFIFKHKHSGQKHSLPLGHGSLLVMAGDTQQYWQHGINKTKRSISDRINLTFRMIHPEENR